MNKTNPYQHLFDEIQPRADRSILESPIEVLFIETLEKFLSSKVEIIPQYEVMTLVGKFRIDFLLTIDEKKIAFECDGQDFHDSWRDEWRDALILGGGEIDTIYRFKGKDLHTFLNDCIYLIYHYDKELFNDRYPLIAPQLTSDEIKNQLRVFHKKETNTIGYKAINEEGNQVGWLLLVMERRHKNDKSGHWNVLFEFAKNNPGLQLNQLMALKERQ